jgi:Zn-dependent protease with chaperone function
VVGAARGVARMQGEGRRALLRVDPALLDAPRAVRRGVVAHELAHLALDHARRARWRVMAVVIALVATASLGLAAGYGAPQRAQLALVGGGAVFLGGQLLVARASRRAELAADRYAVALLGDHEDALRALAWQGERAPAAADSWLARRMATHPSLEQRAAVVRRAAA